MTSATSTTSVSSQPMGITAQLADARLQLRAAAPTGSWDAVLEEVQRLQLERSISLLSALQVVYAKLASGWSPRRS